MKKRNLLSLLLLTGLLASCGVTPQDPSSESLSPTTSETSEHDHSSESGTSEDEHSSHSHDSSSSEEEPCAHGHSLTHYLAKEATCLEEGYKEAWFCNECSTLFFTKPEGTVKEAGKSLTTDSRTILPALGHKFPDSYTVVTNPDCTTNGLQTRTCETCGFVEEKVVPKLNHDYGEVTYNWDITNKKLTATRHCAHGHDETETVDATLIKSVPGTCASKGLDTYRSKAFTNRAFERQTYEVETPIKHTLSYHKANEATCNTHGNTAYYECTGGCGKFFANNGATIEIAVNSWITAYDADNHLVLDDVIAKNPTCSSVGYNAHKICPSCGERVGYEVIPMTAHTANTKAWGAYDSTNHYRLCKDCDAKLTETGEPHHPDHEAPYPTDEDVRCLDCGYLIQAASGSAHKHVLEYVPRQEATCTSTGYVQYYVCQCGAKFADELGTEPISDPEVIPMKNHNLEHHEAHANNCTVDGNSEYYRCKDCNKFFSDSAAEHEISENSWVVPATGHHPDDVWHTDATYHWHECMSCHDVSSKAAHTLSHNLDDELYEDAIACTVCGYEIRAARHVHKNGHLTPHDAVDATCTTAGSSLYYSCTCGRYFSDANGQNEIEEDSWIISANGHDHLNHFDAVPATCVSTGTKEYYSCSVCGAKQLFDGEHYNVISSDDELVIAKNPDNHTHLENHEAKAATCTEAGYDAYVTCIHNGEPGHTDYSTQTNIPALGHDYAGDYYSNASGHWQKCTRCGGNGALTAHTPNRESATATEAKVCTVCGYVIEPATGHSHSGDEMTYHAAVAATCTTDGNSAYYSCSCGKYFSDNPGTNEIVKDSWVIKAHHTYVPHAGTAATCTSTGIKDYFTCSECSKIFVEDNNHNKVETTLEGLVTPINPTNHVSTPIHVNAVEANCAHAGNIEHYHCESCGKYYENEAGTIELLESQVIIPQTSNHTYGAWTVTTTPTCTEAGEETRTCSTCGKVETRPVEALGHSTTHYEAKSPKCTEKGNIEYWYCSTCNKYFTNSALTQEVTQSAVEIPALEGGHEWVIDTSVGNNGFTFATDGKTATVNLKCTKTSGETHSTTVPATVTPSIDTPATCTTDGKTKYTATAPSYGDASASVIRTDITASDHDWKFTGFTWDGNVATANYVCKNDGTHTYTPVKVTVTNNKEDLPEADRPTCEGKGWTTYSATVTAEDSLDHLAHSPANEETATKRIQDINLLNHHYVLDTSVNSGTTPGFTFSEYGSYATVHYYCENDPTDKQTVDALVTPSVKTPATCTNKGWTTYTAAVQADNSLDGLPHAMSIDLEDIDALEHDYITTYTWAAGSSDINKNTVCSNDQSHTTSSSYFSTNKTEMKPAKNWRENTSYLVEGDLSPIYSNHSESMGFGDVNMFFSNYKKDESGNNIDGGGKGMKYDATVEFNFARGDTTNAKENFFVKLDDSFFYYTGVTSKKYEGTSYIILYSDLSIETDGRSDGFGTYVNQNIFYDNRGHSNTNALTNDISFVTDFLAFTKNCRIVVRSHLVPSKNVAYVTITYYTNVDEYKAEYDGYTQTFEVRYNENILKNREVNSFRIARNIAGSTMDILKVQYSYNIDRNVVSSSYIEAYVRYIWPVGDQFENVRDPIVNISGNENNHIW